MNHNRMPTLPVLILTLGVSPLLGCSGGGAKSPTEATSPTLTLTNAAVMVNGQLINGMTLGRGNDQSGGWRFEAKMQKNGQPISGGTMQVWHETPGMSMMSGTHFMLYDDGTHGDLAPGDGIFSYEDIHSEYGCLGRGAAMGEHHYDFSGTDGQGHTTNIMQVSVTVTQ